MENDGRFYEMPSRDQPVLLGPSLRQAVAEAPDVLALDAAVEQLDTAALEARYRRVGHPAYAPKLMLKVLVYGYAIGLRASRDLERACRFDDRFRFLAHGLRPDYSSLCRFRHDHPQEFKEWFVQTVRLCQAAGLVELGNVAVDGTKIRANRSRERLRQARQFVQQAVAEAEAADAGLLTEESAPPRADSSADAVEGGAGDNQPQATAPPQDECRLMKTRQGIEPAYNAQVAVDGAHGVIVAQQVVSAPTDQGQLAGMVQQVADNCNAAPSAVSADGGYLSQASLEQMERQGITAYLPLPARGGDEFEWVQSAGAFRCPAGRWLRPYRVREGRQIYRTHRCGGCAWRADCGVTRRFKEISMPLPDTARGRLYQRMQGAEGQSMYDARQQIVEPVFGDFKHNDGFDRFLLHGSISAGIELSLKCIGHNLGKWARAVLVPGASVAGAVATAARHNSSQLSRSLQALAVRIVYLARPYANWRPGKRLWAQIVA